MEKSGCVEKFFYKVDEKMFIKNELEKIPEKIIFLESVRQVKIKGYNLFIGGIDFEYEIKENYNIYYEDNKKYVRFNIFPYSIFYEEMYILEHKENGLKFCVFFRVELESIFFKKNQLVNLYKQKNVQIAVSEFLSYIDHNIDKQIIYAQFPPKLYFVNENITNLCIQKAYSYIENEYFKNKIRVEEYCEDSVYVKKSQSKQNINSLEEYFNIALLNEAYDKIKNNCDRLYTKNIVVEGATISIIAKEEIGEKHCKIYLILDNKEYFFASIITNSKVIKVDLEFIADSYEKENSYVLYDAQTYNSTLKELFKKVCIGDLS